MLEKILSVFFTKEYPHKNRRVTLIKNREVCNAYFNRDSVCPIIEKKTDEEQTCLSKYFINNRGLNVKERFSIN